MYRDLLVHVDGSSADGTISVVDPGGLPVTLGSPAFTAPTGVQVEVDGSSLIVTAPVALSPLALITA